jgi:alkanesulfonate monooxygenase SsuD/methylene tetrahydromethanopterin reductase-like flavin-dependent oxidoreductase (luciferase family)
LPALEFGVHLQLVDVGQRSTSREQIHEVVAAAKSIGCRAIAASDRLAFGQPWLDGPMALSAAAALAPDLQVATTVVIPALRGTAQTLQVIRALAAISERRVIVGIGAGAAREDFNAAGIPWSERWPRFDASRRAIGRAVAEEEIPADVWVGSWGGTRGLALAAKSDGLLVSAMHTSPHQLRKHVATIERQVPVDVTTMWLAVTEDGHERSNLLNSLAARFGTRVVEASDRLCVGGAEHCAGVLSAYAAAGARRIYVWPAGNAMDQLERLSNEVLPAMVGRSR